MPNIELFNEDCMKVMDRYPDNYFDLACVDPPYGIGESGGKSNQRDSKQSLVRVSKKNPTGKGIPSTGWHQNHGTLRHRQNCILMN